MSPSLLQSDGPDEGLAPPAGFPRLSEEVLPLTPPNAHKRCLRVGHAEDCMKAMHEHHPNVKQPVLERTMRSPPISSNEDQQRYQAALSLQDLSQSSRLHQGSAGSKVWITPRVLEDHCIVTSCLASAKASHAFSDRPAVYIGAKSPYDMLDFGLDEAPLLSLEHVCGPLQSVPCSFNATKASTEHCHSTHKIIGLPLTQSIGCCSVTMLFLATCQNQQLYSTGTEGHYENQQL